ncbi:hypothetical protein C0J52_14311 [Blattella germanica]|nr:hypothetical protein C0J52_14311 [Blattella germanica]
MIKDGVRTAWGRLERGGGGSGSTDAVAPATESVLGGLPRRQQTAAERKGLDHEDSTSVEVWCRMTAVPRRRKKDFILSCSGSVAVMWVLLFLVVAPAGAVQYPGHGMDVDNALQPVPAGG